MYMFLAEVAARAALSHTRTQRNEFPGWGRYAFPGWGRRERRTQTRTHANNGTIFPVLGVAIHFPVGATARAARTLAHTPDFFVSGPADSYSP